MTIASPPKKGLFTQSACVLLSRIPSPDELRQALLLATETESRQAQGGKSWCEGGPLHVIPFAPERNGFVLVDLVKQSWPDALGQEQAPDDEVTSAWQTGHFGPGTWPGCLERSAQHSWAWKAGALAAVRHVAFLRIRLTYLLGVPGGVDRPYLASDPVSEQLFLSHIVGALLTIRGALGYFNPAGETLRQAAYIEERIQHHRLGGPPPLEVWTNVRYLPVGESSSWIVMDTVGMSQFDQPDIEVAFPQDKQDRYPAPEVEAFLRNAALRLLNGGVTAAAALGDKPGPGGALWRSQSFPVGFAYPPRPVLRFFPRILTRPPAALRR